eukprot:g15885.t1
MRSPILPGLLGVIFLCGRDQAAESPSPSTMQRYALPSAVCVDQSPGYFYASMNSTSNDFVVRLMGGGGCVTEEQKCATGIQDGTILFSSDGMPEVATGFGVLSGDSTENPSFSTYNRIMVPYCTQDMFLMDTESSDGELQFRGRSYLEEALTAAIGNQTQNSTVVLVGSSSGGIGAFNVVNWLFDSFEQVTELSVILDSSFFFDVRGTLAPLLEYAQEDPSRAYTPTCAEEFEDTVCCVQFGCMLQRGYYPYGDDRLRGTFILALTQDPLPAILGADSSDEEDVEGMSLPALWDAATYSGKNAALLRNLASVYPEAISLFAPSCVDHSLLVASNIDLWMCSPGEEEPMFGSTQWIQCPPGLSCTGACTLEDDGRPSAITVTGTMGDVGLRVQSTYSIRAWETVKIDGTSVRRAMEAWWEGRGNATKQVVSLDACDDLNCNPTCQTKLLPGTREATDGALVWTVVLVTLAVMVALLAAGAFAFVWAWRRGANLVSLAASSCGGKPLPLARLVSSGLDLSGQDVHPCTDTGAESGSGVAMSILEWRALNYWLPPSQGESKQLLCSMDGMVPEGALCALMGPSGSGKSTLLDLLTGRRDYGRCGGTILFEGASVAIDQDSYISQAGYMRQGNSGYLEGLTVLENLAYAVMLRFSGSVKAQSERVKAAIEQTVLEESMHTKAAGLSGGLRRRLKLALELLADRRILFLDEPTSGLDAHSSLELMNIMKRLSGKVTLVVAIHQPRPEVWRLFSYAILLSRGRTVYCGPADGALAATTSYLLQLNASAKKLDPVTKDEGTRALPSASHRNLGDSDRGSLPSMRGGSSSTSCSAGCGAGPTERAGHDVSDRPSVISTMPQWELAENAGNVDVRDVRSGFGLGLSRRSLRALPPADAPTTHRNSPTPANPEASRSVPDRMLDSLMMIEVEERKIQAAEEGPEASSSIGSRSSFLDWWSAKGAQRLEVAPVHSSTLDTTLETTEVEAGDDGHAASGSAGTLPVWKTAAVLLVRTWKGGYGMEMLSASITLVIATSFIMFSLRSAAEVGSVVLQLTLSALLCPLLPVLLVYSAVFIVNTRQDWDIINLEVSDGFYHPICAITRVVLDHFNVAVLMSLGVVALTYAIYWAPFISGLPTSAFAVYVQVSCAVTLSGWMVIGLLDAMVISGLSLSKCHGISNGINTIWAVFSGTVMLVGSLPLFLRLITFSSPHYWATSFILRVVLDGLDMASLCDYNSQLYCALNYGDIMVWAFDLRIFATGTAAIAIAASALAAFYMFLVTTFVKSRSVRVVGGLRGSTATGDVPSPESDGPAGSRRVGFER